MLTDIIVVSVLLLLALFFLPPCIFFVNEKERAIVTRLGKFRYIAEAGPHFKLWFFDAVSGTLSLRVEQLDVPVESKAKDNVFVTLMIAVQHQVIEGKVKEAFYSLTNAEEQIKAYVFDVVRAQVPLLTLEELFEKKEEIATAVKESLSATMDEYGFKIVNVLVNDITPDEGVKEAMNDVRAAEQRKKQAEYNAEAAKITVIAEAEAQKQSKILHGEGIAGQREAIAKGLRASIDEVKGGAPDVSEETVLAILMMNQHLDTMRDIGGNSRTNVVFLDSSPGASTDLQEKIRNGLLQADAAGIGQSGKQTKKEAAAN